MFRSHMSEAPKLHPRCGRRLLSVPRLRLCFKIVILTQFSRVLSLLFTFNVIDTLGLFFRLCPNSKPVLFCFESPFVTLCNAPDGAALRLQTPPEA